MGALPMETSMEYCWNQRWRWLWIWIDCLFMMNEALEGQPFFWESSRVGAILFYFQSWTTSSWKILLRISWLLRDSYIFWKLRVFQKSLDFIYAGGWRTSTSTSTKSSTLFRRCAELMEYRSLLANTTSSTPMTLKVCRSSYWMWTLVCM